MVDANTKFSRDLMWAEACLNKVKAQFAEKDGGPPTKDWDTFMAGLSSLSVRFSFHNLTSILNFIYRQPLVVLELLRTLTKNFSRSTLVR